MFNMKNLTKKIVVALVAISLVPATSTLALAHGGHHGGGGHWHPGHGHWHPGPGHWHHWHPHDHWHHWHHWHGGWGPGCWGGGCAVAAAAVAGAAVVTAAAVSQQDNTVVVHDAPVYRTTVVHDDYDDGGYSSTKTVVHDDGYSRTVVKHYYGPYYAG